MTVTATLDPRPSIASARRSVAQSFRRDGLATPELDARLMVAHALGLDHAALAAQAARTLTEAEAAAIAAFAARRRAREPVARIIGVKEFWGLNFKLNTATLVPRPETEVVVEAALDAVDRSQARGRALRVADLGTGSGALLLALLSELPLARGFGTDVSREALGCARDNAVALGLAERASFLACDYGSALKGPFDLVVSNPPYVARDDIASLAPEADPTVLMLTGRSPRPRGNGCRPTVPSCSSSGSASSARARACCLPQVSSPSEVRDTISWASPGRWRSSFCHSSLP